MELPVHDSVKKAAAKSRFVFLHPGRADEAVSDWGGLISASSSWDHPCHFFDGTDETVRWIFTLDVLNHCFWPDPGCTTWTVPYRGEGWSGYLGLAAALKRGMEEAFPLTDAAYLSTISEVDLTRIFEGEGEIPMFAERLLNLREAGSVLVRDFDADAANLVRSAAGSAVRLVTDIVSRFKSFRDDAFFEGGRVYFWKRAQIFASDLYTAFSGRDWGGFGDIEKLTAFADYKLPQVLRELGVISYREDLGERVDSLDVLASGSPEEVEIRAATVVAVEMMRQSLKRAGTDTTSREIDGRLWQLGQLDLFRARPYHRCRTIYY